MNQPLVEHTEPDQHEATPPAVRRDSKKRWGRWMLFALLLLGGVIGFFVFQRKEKAATDKPPSSQVGIPISTAVAEKGSIAVYINA